MESDMLVYTTYSYKKEKIGDKKIVNEMFEMFDCIGQGAFWRVHLVQRNLVEDEVKDNNFYVFKEGRLSEGCKYCPNDLDIVDSDEEYRRGVKEYNILSEVNHKNIARLYECIMDYELDKIVLVMEYADLGDLMSVDRDEEKYVYNIKMLNFILKECIQEDSFQFEENYQITFEKDHKILTKLAKFIFKQFASSISYLHERKISHRDIKPDNISMRSLDKSVKLLDFSNAKKIKSEEEFIPSEGGTPAFDPPELNINEQCNPFKGDVYSLGATLYVFLFNEIEFDLEGENIKILKDKVKGLYNLLTKLMNKDPLKRPEINEVLQDEFFS